MAIAIGVAAPTWAHGITERVSLGPGGVQGDERSVGSAISADGRFLAFGSLATNLVPGDTNGSSDVFVRDRQTGITELVSLGPGGVQGDRDSFTPAISADGRFVAFTSVASNLVPGAASFVQGIFVRDRQKGTTERVSLGPGGVQANNFSFTPAISADGRFVAFESDASNLVPGDTNHAHDIFVRDRQTGSTRRVNLGPAGVQSNGQSFAPAISADGRFVAFFSIAGNLVPGDTNGQWDVFVRDRQAGTTRRVSLGPAGVQGNGSSFLAAISANGRFVAFDSQASNLVPGDTNGVRDVFVRDRQAGTTRRVSLGPAGVQGNSDSYFPTISADGWFVAFEANASNLVPGDTNKFSDVFVRDRKTGSTRRVSVGPAGVQGNGQSFLAVISANGQFVAFTSEATNLVLGDTNGAQDAFVRTLMP